MSPATLIFIFLALALSAAAGYWAYLWKKARSTTNVVLTLLRTAALFVVGLLLINPQFSTFETEQLKPRLYILADNSKSVGLLGGTETTKDWIERLGEDEDLASRFEIQFYGFDGQLYSLDSVSLQGEQSNIGAALRQLNELAKGQPAATVLLSDGNQNTGATYDFGLWDEEFHVFPIAVGDTTRYEDLRIRQLILNKYAFEGNRFPVEVSWQYSGSRASKIPLQIRMNGQSVAQASVNIAEGTGRNTFYLTAEQTGIKRIEAVFGNLDQERNTENNKQLHRIEVIDETIKIGLISNLSHPDLGALKVSLEDGGQREVSILDPAGPAELWSDYSLFILFQPNRQFASIFQHISQSRTPYWLIAGTETQWSFINSLPLGYQFRPLGQREGIQGGLQESFALFDWGSFDPTEYPPLDMALGEIDFLQSDRILFNQRIRGVDLSQPLLFFPENAEHRTAVLLGEGLWKWRMHSYRTTQSFEEFDQAVSLIVRYLSASQKKERLIVDFESTYRKGEQAKMSARYFDPTFVFDAKASLMMELEKEQTGELQRLPFALRSNRYELDLSILDPGIYNFTVQEVNSKRRVSGQFEILNFNLEQLALFTQHIPMKTLAEKSGGKLFFPDQWESFKTSLLTNNDLLVRQRSREIVVPLIQLKILLFLLAGLLSVEWFVRKYRGWI